MSDTAMEEQREPRDAVGGPEPASPPAPAPAAPSAEADAQPRFPVVAIGASAGGLQALKQLFRHLPAETGLAFVVIQHLDPEHPSMLAKVLEKSAALAVVEATDGMRLEPDRVHVIPPAFDLAVRDGALKLLPRQMTGRLHLPIDSFFRSLAEDARARPIGVVLSGSGADGTEGLRAIKAEGGIALAQAPDSAQFRSMPESALAAGVVDFCADPEQIAGELARLGRHPYLTAAGRAKGAAGSADSTAERSLARIFAVLRRRAGVDFSGYKRTSVLRRIERRMALRRTNALGDYAGTVEGDPDEARALAQDMLIHVTSFFRDPESFEALKPVFTELARRKGAGDSIRVWAPGCATGEEAYALTMCLLESLGEKEQTLSIKLFGTDLSEEAIETARRGVYSETALVGVSPERLSRFFERAEGGYRVGRLVREPCVFVTHDLTSDPPFARLDLISCRNVLIYFDAELQHRVVPMLHYCLNPQGYLFLGQSETIAGFRDLFAPVDEEHRIFVKTGSSVRLADPLSAGREAEAKIAESRPAVRRPLSREALRQADHLLLARFAPPGVVVNDRLEIIQFRGRTGDYLEPAPGEPQANVLRMAREGLLTPLREALEGARAEGAMVRRTGLRASLDPEAPLVDVEVVPLAAVPESQERFFLVLFHDAGGDNGSPAPRASRPSDPEPAAATEQLRTELVATQHYIHALLSEHQSTTDELAAANEELVAANEELQSTNEELQTAKEELQSTNEELITVNDQLRLRNVELDQTANDLVNVLSSVEMPVIIVDLGLRVRRFTPTATSIARFTPEDVGRSIDDIELKVRVEDLGGKIGEVVDGLVPKDWEVQRDDGRWFRLQVRPYRTFDNRLDGAVLAFVDVDALRRALQDAEAARDYAQSIVETVSAALVVLDADQRVVSANEAFYDTFALSARVAPNKRLSEIGGAIWRAPAVRSALKGVLDRQEPFAFDLATRLPARGRRVFALTGRPIAAGDGGGMVLLAIEDVTELRSYEAERTQLLASEKKARIEAERATRAKDLFLATLSHELRTPLSTMLMSAQLLRHLAVDDRRVERASAAIERAATTQTRLIEDLLDVSRMISGKLMLDLGPVDFAAVVEQAVDVAQPVATAKGLELELTSGAAMRPMYGDSMRLQQVVSNLLTNAIKFTPHGGRVSVHLERVGEKAQLTVTDTGMGIAPEVLPRLFSRFVQADSSVTRTHGGLGLGLSIVRHLVDVHGGDVYAESAGLGKGSTFRVILPLGTVGEAMPEVVPRSVVRSIAGTRILLVDDDEDTRETYAAMLTEMGAEVRAVGNVAAGLAAYEELRPEVILSDIAMPGEDGFSFIRRVRGLELGRDERVPAAAISALAGDNEREEALRSGFQVHAAKPVDAARLASIVSMLLASGAGEAAAERDEPPT